MNPPSVPRAMFAAVVFVAFVTLLIVTSWIATGDPAMPPPPGDAPYYDNLAMQLVRGHGYVIDYSDADWRRPYEQSNQESGDYGDILSHQRAVKVRAERSPLLPLILAITYRIFGRSYFAWRVVASILCAAGIALVIDVAWRAFGSSVALVSAAIMFVSATYVSYVAQFGLMTEPLAIVLIAMLVWLLSDVRASSRLHVAVLSGIVVALLCLTRNFYITWIPFIAGLVAWLLKRNAARAAIAFIAAAVVLQLPWWIYIGHFTLDVPSPINRDPGFVTPVFWLVAGAPFVLWRRRASIRIEIVLVLVMILVLTIGALAMSWRTAVPAEPLFTVFAALPITAMLFSERSIAAEVR